MLSKSYKYLFSILTINLFFLALNSVPPQSQTDNHYNNHLSLPALPIREIKTTPAKNPTSSINELPMLVKKSRLTLIPESFKLNGINFIKEFEQTGFKSTQTIYKELKNKFNLKMLLELFISDERNLVTIKTSTIFNKIIISTSIRTVSLLDIDLKYINLCLQKVFQYSLEKILQE